MSSADGFAEYSRFRDAVKAELSWLKLETKENRPENPDGCDHEGFGSPTDPSPFNS